MATTDQQQKNNYTIPGLAAQTPTAEPGIAPGGAQGDASAAGSAPAPKIIDNWRMVGTEGDAVSERAQREAAATAGKAVAASIPGLSHTSGNATPNDQNGVAPVATQATQSASESSETPATSTTPGTSPEDNPDPKAEFDWPALSRSIDEGYAQQGAVLQAAISQLKKPKSPEEVAREQKKERSRRIVAAVTDGLSALGNLYFTTQYAPSQYDPSKSSSAHLDARLQRAREAREKNDAAYYDALGKMAELQAKRNQDQLKLYEAQSKNVDREERRLMQQERLKMEQELNDGKLDLLDAQQQAALALALKRQKEAEQAGDIAAARIAYYEAQTILAHARKRASDRQGSGTTTTHYNRDALGNVTDKTVTKS